MDTFWCDREPGQFAAQGKGEDECAVLVGVDGPPDWVLIPPGIPELSGRRVRVTDHFQKLCPMCDSQRPCLHLVLGSVDLYVCECLEGCGFVFYRLRKEDSDADPA
jgi:hypothetical protein